MRLHLPGLPHTVTDDAHSHCAYTGKVQKFPAMMSGRYEVIHYGVAGADVACEHVDLMTRTEQCRSLGERDERAFVGDVADITSRLYKEFNLRLRMALAARYEPGDLVLLPFGHAHADAVVGSGFTLVESGIGYPTLYGPAHFRIFESAAWMHWHQGRANRNGRNYEWVIPNYFDTAAWKFDAVGDPDTVVYFGRICHIKGLDVVVEIARRRPDLRFVLCGQGDPEPYLVAPNIEYRPPISGRARSQLLGGARAILVPSLYTEPFGGVAVEAMMCGTPALTSPFGAFTETVEDEVTGYRCHTLGDWLGALDRTPELDRAYISERARRLYGYERVGTMYERAFGQIADLWDEGWYTERDTLPNARMESWALQSR